MSRQARYLCSLVVGFVGLFVAVNVRVTQLLLVDFNNHVVLLTEDFGELRSIDALVIYELELVLGTELMHDVLALREVLGRGEHRVHGQAN